MEHSSNSLFQIQQKLEISFCLLRLTNYLKLVALEHDLFVSQFLWVRNLVKVWLDPLLRALQV